MYMCVWVCVCVCVCNCQPCAQSPLRVDQGSFFFLSSQTYSSAFLAGVYHNCIWNLIHSANVYIILMQFHLNIRTTVEWGTWGGEAAQLRSEPLEAGVSRGIWGVRMGEAIYSQCHPGNTEWWVDLHDKTKSFIPPSRSPLTLSLAKPGWCITHGLCPQSSPYQHEVWCSQAIH
jgi:hypothetical protein